MKHVIVLDKYEPIQFHETFFQNKKEMIIPIYLDGENG